MKKALSIFFCLAVVLCLSACSYHPPEGWTKKHHTYEEVLVFAKSIDPNATVAEKYTDTVDENDWKFREWDAVIKGVRCHVASVSDWVWNDGVSAGEFVRDFYRIDTDYDYTIMKSILSEKYPDWTNQEDIYGRYHKENTIFVELKLAEYRMLNGDELEQVWQTAFHINEEYEMLAIDRKVEFCIPSPGESWNHHGEQESFVKKDSYAFIKEFTEEGKQAFLQEYQEDWALLKSGLPVYD